MRGSLRKFSFTFCTLGLTWELMIQNRKTAGAKCLDETRGPGKSAEALNKAGKKCKKQYVKCSKACDKAFEKSKDAEARRKAKEDARKAKEDAQNNANNDAGNTGGSSLTESPPLSMNKRSYPPVR